MLDQTVDGLRERDTSPELTIPRIADWGRKARWVEACDRVSQGTMRFVERTKGRLPRLVVRSRGRGWPVAHLRLGCHVALQTPGDLTGPRGHVEDKLPDGVNRRTWPTSRFVYGDIGKERCARGAVPGIAAMRPLELIDEELRQCWIRHAVMHQMRRRDSRRTGMPRRTHRTTLAYTQMSAIINTMRCAESGMAGAYATIIRVNAAALATP